MAKSNETKTEGIVTSDSVRSKRKQSPTAFIAGGLVLFTLVWLLALYSNQKPDSPQPAKQLSSAEALAKKKFDDLHASQQKALESKLANAQTPEAKSAVYEELANLASAKGKYDQAYEYAGKAYKEKATVGSCVALAVWSEQKKEYTQAAKLYREAAKLVYDTSNPETGIAKAHYEATAKRLEAMQ